MTDQEIDQLFAAALEGGYDDDAPWAAVSQLRSNGDIRVFTKAADWCKSAEPLERARGAAILCQLRAPRTQEQNESNRPGDPIFVAESSEIIKRMLAGEVDLYALNSEISALGHLYYEDAVPLILGYADHPNEDIRYSVTHSLGHFSQDNDAIEALIRLADDSDDDVRNWALFALGSQSNFDSPELRELFVRHLNDSFADAREEAIAGLAKRKDERAVVPLLRLMQGDSYYIHHVDDFEALVGEHRNRSDEWDADDFIDALYARYPHLLPPRAEAKT